METNSHDIINLFSQLGLPANEEYIEEFISEHYPLDSSVLLREAPFWSPGQAKFIREQIKLDADWCVAIDKLDTQLRQQ